MYNMRYQLQGPGSHHSLHWVEGAERGWHVARHICTPWPLIFIIPMLVFIVPKGELFSRKSFNLDWREKGRREPFPSLFHFYSSSFFLSLPVILYSPLPSLSLLPSPFFRPYLHSQLLPLYGYTPPLLHIHLTPPAELHKLTSCSVTCSVRHAFNSKAHVSWT